MQNHFVSSQTHQLAHCLFSKLFARCFHYHLMYAHAVFCRFLSWRSNNKEDTITGIICKVSLGCREENLYIYLTARRVDTILNLAFIWPFTVFGNKHCTFEFKRAPRNRASSFYLPMTLSCHCLVCTARDVVHYYVERSPYRIIVDMDTAHRHRGNFSVPAYICTFWNR